MWGRKDRCSWWVAQESYNRNNWDRSKEEYVPDECHLKLEHTVIES